MFFLLSFCLKAMSETDHVTSVILIIVCKFIQKLIT